MISNGFILIINNKSVIIKERRAISICTQHGNSKFEKAKHENSSGGSLGGKEIELI